MIHFVSYNPNLMRLSSKKMPDRICSHQSNNEIRAEYTNFDLYNKNLRISFGYSLLNFNEKFKNEAMSPGNPKWTKAIQRNSKLDKKPNDVRSDFERDRNRIMHSEGYDRLRFKTQVFVAPENDMISTRSSHVAQVTDVARNISRKLGLNEDLTEAIAQGHDLGHAPFGHDGETTLNKISKQNGLQSFWHEKNSLRMVDKLLLLKSSQGKNKNLGLTYAVRDGIINHCGEVDENFIKPRNEFIDLEKLQKPAQVKPYTWEGIVVRISDTIAYLGKDIEDAFRANVLTEKNQKELNNIVKNNIPEFVGSVNNSSLMSLFITDIVKNSSPQKGIGFSEEVFKTLKDIKQYNYKNIYLSPKVKTFTQDNCDEVLNTIYEHYEKKYAGKDTIQKLENTDNIYTQNFRNWLCRYTNTKYRPKDCENEILYNLDNEKDYKQAVIDYISGMTDKYALKTYRNIKGL